MEIFSLRQAALRAFVAIVTLMLVCGMIAVAFIPAETDLRSRALKDQANLDLLGSMRSGGDRGGSHAKRVAQLVYALQRGADPNLRYGSDPSLVAAAWRWVARRQLGRIPGGDETREAQDRWPLLLMAARKNEPEAIRDLITSGADTQATGDSGEHALGCAAQSGSFEAASALLDLGADPNERSGLPASAQQGSTGFKYPLQEALMSPDIIRLLLTRGADPRIMVDGEPFYIFERKRHNQWHADLAYAIKFRHLRWSKERAAPTEARITLSLSLMDACAKAPSNLRFPR